MMNLDFVMPALAKREDDGGYYLEGVASTTDLDQHKEQMDMSALQDMVKAQNVRLTNSHADELNNHIGDLVESRLRDGEFYTKFKMDADDPEAMRLWNKINKGMHAGLSVGGKITATRPGDGQTKRFIKHVELEHVALTLKPANPRTMVEAFAKCIEALDTEETPTMNKPELTKTEDAAVDPVDVIFAKTEELSKIGKAISAANMDKLKSIASMLGELMGDDDGDDPVIGANVEANAVDPVAGGGPAEIKGEANIEKTAAPAVVDIGSLIKSAVAEAFTAMKSERKGFAETPALEKTETPAERFAKAQSLTALRAEFNKLFQQK